MKILKILSVALVAATLTTTTAEARRGSGSTQEELLFVANTEIPGEAEGTTQALCHLVEKHSVLFIPLFYSMQGYAVAENNCDTDSYIPMDAERMESFQSLGMIPADLPIEPEMAFSQKLVGYVWLAIIAGGLGLALMRKRKSAALRKTRHGQMTANNPVANAVLDAMCQLANSDGHVDDSEIEMIAFVGEKIAGEKFSDSQIRAMIKTCQDNPTDQKDFASFGAGLPDAAKNTVMRAALMVAIADGQIAKSEADFLGKLSQALKIPQKTVEGWVAELRTA